MSSSHGEMTMEALAIRLADLEEMHTRLRAEFECAFPHVLEERTLRPAMKPSVSKPLIPSHQGPRKRLKGSYPKTTGSTRKSRRGLLRRGLGFAAAGLSAGALFELNAGSVHARTLTDNPGNFSSSNSSIAAVTTTGTNGADGVSALSDTGAGISGSGGYGIFGNCLGSNGYGVYGVNSSGGIGVYADSNSGGTALVVNGTMQVRGNAVGQATLLTGNTSITITTSAATLSSNIVLTPLNKYKGIVWVTRATGSFIIHTSVTQTSSVAFTYLIIN